MQLQMSERRSNTICELVERPDHHCDDDLVASMPRTSVSDRRTRVFNDEVDRSVANDGFGQFDSKAIRRRCVHNLPM